MRRRWVSTVAVAVVVAGAAAVGLAGAGLRSGHAGRRGLDALPFGARGLISDTLGRADPRFGVRRLGAGWVVRNPAQGLDASFGRAGVVVRLRGFSWSLGLRAVGYGSRLRAVPAVLPEVRLNRVAFVRGGLREWYANGPLGLEQGFSLTGRPPLGGGGPLTLALGLPAGVSPRLANAGGDLVLERSGTALLRYAGLVAVDARGRSLPAWLQATAGRLLVRVDDRGARYPLRVDPLVQGAKLTASDASTYSQVGSLLAVSGDGSVVVARAATAVYVFVRPAAGRTNATQTAKLTVLNGTDGVASVAVSGDDRRSSQARQGPPWGRTHSKGLYTCSSGPAAAGPTRPRTPS